MTTEKQIRLHRFAEMAILGLLALQFFVPMYKSYDEETGGWEAIFLIDDHFLLCLNLPFAAVWVWYWIVRRKPSHKTALVALFLFNLAWCALTYFLAGFMFMDTTPAIGLAIPFLVFPFVVLRIWRLLPRPAGKSDSEDGH